MSDLSHLTNEQLLFYHQELLKGTKRSKRFEDIKAHGTDLKFLYHVVRLLYEAQMILEEGDLDLERHREHLKAIRRGEVSEKDIRNWASEKEKELEKLYHSSPLQHAPDEEELKTLLLNCLEEHYENISNAIVCEDQYKTALRKIQDIIQGVNKGL